MFEQVLSAIKEYNRIIIHRHLKPDGDAIGAQVGLKNLLKDNFPQKEIYAVGDSAGRYSFVEDSTPDDIPNEYYNGALAIILDLSAPALVSDERYKLADKTVRIDHHLFIEKFCDIEVINSTYESCCGLIAEFARECNLKVNALAGKALFTGMVTDSGRFRYDSAGSRTFALASFLLESGFSTADIYKELYADDFEFIRLRASFILKIKFTPKNVGYIYTTKEEFEATGKDSFTISRGMVNTMADLKGVDIWVNFTETNDGVLCEIRSSKYNINTVAVKYGGGGHEKASGATLKDKSVAISLLNDLNDLIQE